MRKNVTSMNVEEEGREKGLGERRFKERAQKGIASVKVNFAGHSTSGAARGSENPNLLDHALHIRREREDRGAELLELVLLVVLHLALRAYVLHTSIALHPRAVHANCDEAAAAGDMSMTFATKARRRSVAVATRALSSNDKTPSPSTSTD